jgi:NCAIR mutase (PurE)-related protein
MRPEDLRDLLAAVARGEVEPEQALDRLKDGPLRQEELGFATLDHHRSVRQGSAEVVFGQGKTVEETVEISTRLAQPGVPVLLTRLDPEKTSALQARFPRGRTNLRARTFMANPPEELEPREGGPFVAIVSAGTSDLPVAEEVAEVCISLEVPIRRFYDVGVAGLHRIMNKAGELRAATALVVVAGMEGALPSVVGGLVSAPVFAVPTSVGYGASFSGLAALLGMLNSCAPGVTVSNIDNGLSAGVAAARVVRLIQDAREDPGQR